MASCKTIGLCLNVNQLALIELSSSKLSYQNNGDQKVMPSQVRKAVRPDAKSIAHFQILMAMETEGKTLDDSIVLTAVEAVFDDPQKGFYFVAEMEGSEMEGSDVEGPDSERQVIASLLITYEWSDWRKSNIWYIQSVFVKSEHRGQGVFKQMYKTVTDEAKQLGVKHIRLYVETENEKAQRVYESLGMKRLPYFMYDAKI